jgi:hypothetical protein
MRSAFDDSFHDLAFYWQHSYPPVVDNLLPQPFQVSQGARQMGILSTNLYKLYINQLLNMYETTGIGYRIGNISVNSTACADDIRCVALSTDGILLGPIAANGKGQVVVFLFTLFVGDV